MAQSQCIPDRVCKTGCFQPIGVRTPHIYTNERAGSRGMCETSADCQTSQAWSPPYPQPHEPALRFQSHCTADPDDDEGNIPIAVYGAGIPTGTPTPSSPDAMKGAKGRCYVWQPRKAHWPGPPYVCDTPAAKCVGGGNCAAQTNEYDCQTDWGRSATGELIPCEWVQQLTCPPPDLEDEIVVNECEQSYGTCRVSACPGQQTSTLCFGSLAPTIPKHTPGSNAIQPPSPKGVCRYGFARTLAFMPNIDIPHKIGLPVIDCGKLDSKMTCELDNAGYRDMGIPSERSTGCTWMSDPLPNAMAQGAECTWSGSPLANHGGEPGKDWKQSYCMGGWRNSIGKHGGYCEQIGEKSACLTAVQPGMFQKLQFGPAPFQSPASWLGPIVGDKLLQGGNTMSPFPSSAKVIQVLTWDRYRPFAGGEIVVRLRNGALNMTHDAWFHSASLRTPMCIGVESNDDYFCRNIIDRQACATQIAHPCRWITGWNPVNAGKPVNITPDANVPCEWREDAQDDKRNWCTDDATNCAHADARRGRGGPPPVPGVPLWGAGTCVKDPVTASPARPAAVSWPWDRRCFEAGLSPAEYKKWFPGEAPRDVGPPYGFGTSPFYCGKTNPNGEIILNPDLPCTSNCAGYGGTCNGEGVCIDAKGDEMEGPFRGKMWCNQTECPASASPFNKCLPSYRGKPDPTQKQEDAWDGRDYKVFYRDNWPEKEDGDRRCPADIKCNTCDARDRQQSILPDVNCTFGAHECKAKGAPDSVECKILLPVEGSGRDPRGVCVIPYREGPCLTAQRVALYQEARREALVLSCTKKTSDQQTNRRHRLPSSATYAAPTVGGGNRVWNCPDHA